MEFKITEDAYNVLLDALRTLQFAKGLCDGLPGKSNSLDVGPTELSAFLGMVTTKLNAGLAMIRDPKGRPMSPDTNR